MLNHVLLIHCTDEKGLIAKISKVLYENDLNIVEMKEHVDELNNLFYMRCEFTGQAQMSLVRDLLISQLPPNSQVAITPIKKKEIIIFATKEHHCLSDILTRNYFGELNAEIKCVISNHQDMRGIVEKFNIDYFHVSHENKTKDEFERDILAITKKYNPDFLVLAKFMRILSPNFVSQYPFRIINIHHSFLPAFIGANPYRQAFDRGIKLIGATAHFVTDNLDEGPIISLKTNQVDHSYSADDMRITGKEIERFVLAEALQMAFDDRIFVTGNKTVIFT